MHSPKFVSNFSVRTLFVFTGATPSSQHLDVWVSKWVDYSEKYGLGYLLSSGACGVYFNDSSRIVLLPDSSYVAVRTLDCLFLASHMVAGNINAAVDSILVPLFSSHVSLVRGAERSSTKTGARATSRFQSRRATRCKSFRRNFTRRRPC